ncbi:hypothetical protein DPMN_001022 [Dreissena polymorpha]|uniref:Uncharacterized protein n=1 Tax=Dreissena polymorpha TaxID=45954 RepID=A0A9D4MJA1_DREPO|nr:hypothetical protein DPMN_001022 [Dreissena polymorpha]
MDTVISVTNVLIRFHLRDHIIAYRTELFCAVQEIIRKHILTKFHKERTINVIFQVLTRFYYSNLKINKTNLLTKFHDNRTINVASRVLTRKNASPPGGHVFQPTIFEPVQEIIGTNLLTKFHEFRTINVSFTV